MLIETVPVSGCRNLNGRLNSVVSRDSGETMNQVSDLRLGGRLLALATVICGGFAAAALISALHNTQGSALNQSDTTGPGRQIVQQEGRRVRGNHPPAVTTFHPRPQTVRRATPKAARPRPRGAQLVSGTSTKHPATVASRSQGPAPSVRQQGVYVPVNVHPVTVNVDGAGLAGQLSRVVDDINGILAAHRDAVPRHPVTETPIPSDQSLQNKTDDGSDRLTQIDARLRDLSDTLESLRLESRSAVTQLREGFEQAGLTTDLVADIRHSLEDHRQLLADSVHGVPAEVPAIEEQPDPESRSTSDEDLHVADRQPADTEPELASPDSTSDTQINSAENFAASFESEDPTQDLEPTAPYFPLFGDEDRGPIRQTSEKAVASKSETMTSRGTPILFERASSFAEPENDFPRVIVRRSPNNPEESESSGATRREDRAAPNPFRRGDFMNFSSAPTSETQRLISGVANDISKPRRRFNPRFRFPKQASSSSTTPLPLSLRGRKDRDVDALGASVSASDLVSRMTRNPPQYPRLSVPPRIRNPSVLHRLGSAIRGLGQDSNVD